MYWKQICLGEKADIWWQKICLSFLFALACTLVPLGRVFQTPPYILVEEAKKRNFFIFAFDSSDPYDFTMVHHKYVGFVNTVPDILKAAN